MTRRSVKVNRYRQEYPDRKVEMINFDVLASPHPEMEKDLIPKIEPFSLYEKYICFGYRSFLALMHLAQRYLSEKLASVLFVPLVLSMKMLCLSPSPYKIDTKVFQSRKIPLDRLRIMYMAYPYVNLIRSMLTGKNQGRNLHADVSLPKDLEKTPVLYMYGTEKRIMFHDHRSVQILKSSKGKSNAISVEDAGHWLYTEGQKMEYCLEQVKEFLDTV